jgi:nucleoside-diphosphate-sugar epimerase
MGLSSRIMVTGGAGYVGCRLVPALLETGASVCVVDKMIFGDDGLDAVRDQIEIRQMDVRCLQAEDLAGFDAIVHLAALSNDPTAEFNPEANRMINLEATARLGRTARDAGVRRFVFASSCSVYYTESANGHIRNETHALDPKGPYSWSKLHAEIALLELACSTFSPVILRKGTVYGCSPRMRYDLVVNTFTRDAFAKRRLTVHAGGRTWRPLLHMSDAVDAYKTVLSADRSAIHGQVFNILSANHQVSAIAHEVKRTLEERHGVTLELDILPVGVSRSYRVTGEKFRDQLGVNLCRGIHEAVHEMWDASAKVDDLDNLIYCNISWLELLADMELRLKRMGGSPF